MNGQTCADQRSIASRKTLRLQYNVMAVENGVKRGQMIVMYGLGDGIVLAETGNVIKTRLDRHPRIHDSQTTSWMDLGKLRLSRQSMGEVSTSNTGCRRPPWLKRW